MFLQTPKEKSHIWILAGIQFFLIPINNYVSDKIRIEYSDLQIGGESAFRTLVFSFAVLVVFSIFIIPFIYWALENYPQETSLLNFNKNRLLWSVFWTLLIADWMFVELFFFLKFFDGLYTSEAFNIVQSGLLIYLFLCLRTSITSKIEKSKLDIIIACFTLLFTIIIQTLFFL